MDVGRTTRVWWCVAVLVLAWSAGCNDEGDRVSAAGGSTGIAGMGRAGVAGDIGAAGDGPGGTADAGGSAGEGANQGGSDASQGAQGGAPEETGAASGTGGSAGASDGGSAGGGGTPVVPPDGPGFEFESISLPGVSLATDFAWVPGHDDELLVLTHPGSIHHLRWNGESYDSLGEVELPGVNYHEGCGLLSLVFDPDFEHNHFLYLAYCSSHFESRITRHVFTSLASIPDSDVDILSVATEESPAEEWHRWGSMGFEPDGETMWAFLGDNFIKPNGQDVTEKFGSLLRIEPARTEGSRGYSPAEGNAFEEPEGDPSVYAYGFRSPWRGTRDRRGRFWIGDVGLVTYEEVNLVTEAGQNFGWSRAEGPCKSDCDGIEEPKIFYGRNDDDDIYAPDDPDAAPNVRRAVWVGQMYDSPSVDRYFGFHDDLLIFGEFFTGWVRGLRVDASGKVTDDVFLGHLAAVASWRTGPDGYMYALVHDGVLERALPRKPAP